MDALSCGGEIIMQKGNDASAIILAEYIQGLSYDSIPDSAKSDCKKLLLDTLGVMLRGSRTEPTCISFIHTMATRLAER